MTHSTKTTLPATTALILIHYVRPIDYVSQGRSRDGFGLQSTKIKPRKVKIADKDTVMVDGYCTFEAKIADLPKETITAYTFPLDSIYLILCLPWLRKHNPCPDWRTLGWEFMRDGRRHMLWPAKPNPDIHIDSPEEFASFVDKDTSFFLIAPPEIRDPPGDGRELPKLTRSKSNANPDISEPGLPRRLARWIKRHYPDMLREIQRPSNLLS